VAVPPTFTQLARVALVQKLLDTFGSQWDTPCGFWWVVRQILLFIPVFSIYLMNYNYCDCYCDCPGGGGGSYVSLTPPGGNYTTAIPLVVAGGGAGSYTGRALGGLITQAGSGSGSILGEGAEISSCGGGVF
jgi:hypothetical protein